jgi:hypothetical protein
MDNILPKVQSQRMANLVVVWFPEPQADFLEVPEEGVAEQMDPMLDD